MLSEVVLAERLTVSPVPDRVTVCVDPVVALSVTVRIPESEPPAVGAKVTEIVQLAAAARLAPQVLVSWKLAVAAIELMVSAAVPLLVRVTVCAALVLPSLSALKVKALPDSVAPGEPPPPELAFTVTETAVAVLAAKLVSPA